MKLSIVTTLYHSQDSVNEFHRRASDAARELVGDDYEIIFVNDGSPDNSLDLAVELTRRDRYVTVVDLSRNFGHHKAMMAGLSYAKGASVFLIDSDLEEDPEWLSSFSEQMEREGCDVVYGVQEKRKGGWFERWSGSLYYWFLGLMLSIEHPKNITTVRLMMRRYVDALLLHGERELVISCLWVITGFKQCPLIVQKKSSGRSTYNIIRKFSHMVNTVTSFSARPLIAIFFTGVTIFAGTSAYALVLVVRRLFFFKPLAGWTSIMVSVWLLGGIIISFIGVIGIYLSKIFTETKQRPTTIVREVFHGSER